jgi:alpha-N-arabinofuranosidase
VLEHTYEHVDDISLHSYDDPGDRDRASFLASAVDMDAMIDRVAATADHVAAKLRQKRKLQLSFVSPTYETARYGAVPVLDAVAVYSEEEGALSVVAVNRGDEPLRLAIDLRDLDGMLPVRHTTVVAGAHPDAINTPEAPDRVLPVELAAPDLDGGRASATLPAISWNLLRFAARPL